jgi:hypothetical protein
MLRLSSTIRRTRLIPSAYQSKDLFSYTYSLQHVSFRHEANRSSNPFHYQQTCYFSVNPKLPVPIDTEDKEIKKTEETQTTEAVKKPNIVIRTLKAIYSSAKDVILNPRATWQWIKEGAHHYWVGSKLLWSEFKITWKILGRVRKGHEMTRRERRQLIRTSTDLFRLIPFAIFVIVPFMEFLLPFALKLFPNMLPSTFEDSLKKEESLRKDLQMRLAVAKFMQETMQEMASKKANSGEAGAGEVSWEKRFFIFFVANYCFFSFRF